MSDERNVHIAAEHIGSQFFESLGVSAINVVRDIGTLEMLRTYRMGSAAQRYPGDSNLVARAGVEFAPRPDYMSPT